MRVVSSKLLKTNRENTQLKVEIYYSRGGWNVFTGNEDPRGFWISVQPVSHSETAGIKMESFVVGSGLKKFLTETKADRPGGKAEQAAVALAKELESGIVAKVCRKENLSLAA